MKSPLKVLLAHPGTQYSRYLAKQLHKNGLLYRFETGIAFGDNGWQKKLIGTLPTAFKNKISNRIIHGVPDNLIRRHALGEIKALRALRNGKKNEAVFLERNSNFQNNILDSTIKGADVVIGFDTSSWILAKRCRQFDKPFILDVSIAHPYEKRTIYDDILKKYPDWAFALEQKDQKMIDLELLEMELAHKIVVASTFSKNSLINQGIAEDKVFVNPYGTDIDFFKSTEKHNEKVNFVFVGLVDARKGIPVLLDAWGKLPKGNAKLTLIGPINTEAQAIVNQIAPEIIIKGRVPYDELPGLLADQDVLVFPSYFEGFALVIPECMAAGLTVISTSATCAPDVIDEGVNGFIVPCGDALMLAEKMKIIINDRSKLKRMQTEAVSKAHKFTWEVYGKTWEKIIKQVTIF
jgi:glycosyltransferase involved in cell wall biosynthesis